MCSLCLPAYLLIPETQHPKPLASQDKPSVAFFKWKAQTDAGQQKLQEFSNPGTPFSYLLLFQENGLWVNISPSITAFILFAGKLRYFISEVHYIILNTKILK